jgi:hypothetical protein
MKKLSWTILAVAACTANVEAAGDYDGVYQYGLSPVYYSVHQNGNTLLVVSLGQLPTNGSVQVTVGPYAIAPTTLGDWDYAIGTISGNKARISGMDLYGSCITVSDVTFESGNAIGTFVSATNTAFGTQQGVNCSKLLGDAAASVGGSITLRRIF